jgi:hypothetical protein
MRNSIGIFRVEQIDKSVLVDDAPLFMQDEDSKN